MLRWLPLLVLVCACEKHPPAPPEMPDQQAAHKVDDSKAVAANNRGVGLMGQFDYVAACDAFAEALMHRPGWLAARVNLAIATLNRQQEGDIDEAMRLLEGVLENDPGNARAHYCLGLLKLYLGPPNDPLTDFLAAAKAVPDDAGAAYYTGQTLARRREYENALPWFERAIEADPYLRSALYAASRALRLLGRAEEADEYLAAFQKMENNPRAHTIEFKYTRMGDLALAIAPDAAGAGDLAADMPEGEPFAPARELHIAGISDSLSTPTSVTACDINDDGDLDLLLTGAGADSASNIVLMGAVEGFVVGADHPLAGVPDVNAALWGDIDNDGRTDVYLCRSGPNQLWKNLGGGQWENITETAGVAGGDRNTIDGVIFDADHDGDLDIYMVNADGPNELLSNNLNGTFRSIGDQMGLAGPGEGSRQAVVTDLDGDRDADIIVIHAQPPHDVFLNDRMWAYHRAKGAEAFARADIAALVHADFRADGAADLVSLNTEGAVHHWVWTGDGLHHAGAVDDLVSPEDVDLASLSVLDADGDSRLDLLVSSPSGWWLLDPAREGAVVQRGDLRRATPIAFDPRGPMLYGLGPAGEFAFCPPGGGRHFSYARITLSGMHDAGKAMRSNASGIGARVAVRNGSQWTVLDTWPNSSAPGQSLTPLAIGLAGREQADFIEIDWSDGVFQTELNIPAGETTHIVETQRQLSSCPVLFAFNGERYEFVSDLLGVGGIGYAIGPNQYATPRPWENFLLPEDSLALDADGLYRLALAEPMEEACYLDQVGLVAYDLPPGWHMMLDERMGIGDPQPTGEARFYREEILPIHARNQDGRDVVDALVRADFEPAPVPALDERFIGRLARDHVLTLEFAKPISAGPGEPMLIADGWVEYPYSQTSFAAWQAGAEYRAPTIEARTAGGEWIVLLEQIGYPAGMPRRISIPLPGLPEGCTAIRLRTNQEIYWDRLAVAFAEPCPDVRMTRANLADATLSYLGFPKRTTGSDRLPQYDYENCATFWDTRYQQGMYTRFGPVDALVSEHDDAVAIFGPGEQIELAFRLPGSRLKTQDSRPTWTRRFVLETRGWCKDMDMFTRTGETIAPLPTSGASGDVRDHLHAKYNTRFQAGR